MMNPDSPEWEKSKAGRIFLQTQWLWRICLCLPFFYLGVAWLIERLWFIPASRPGFWASAGAGGIYGLWVTAGGVAVGIQAVSAAFYRFFAGRLAAPNLSPERMARLYWRRTVYMVACADLVSGIGLIFFLLCASWTALAVFCGFSYLLYAQAYPRARLLCRMLGIS